MKENILGFGWLKLELYLNSTPQWMMIKAPSLYFNNINAVHSSYPNKIFKKCIYSAYFKYMFKHKHYYYLLFMCFSGGRQFSSCFQI